MIDPQIGGGVAPGRAGTKVRNTGVRKVPYWVPWDEGGKGAWRLIPKDTVHGAQAVDSNNQPHDPYEFKGFIPQRYAPQDALVKLVKLAQDAETNNASLGLSAPDWARGVLAEYPELAKAKVPVGADAA